MLRPQRHRKVSDTVRTGHQARENAGMECVGDRAGCERLLESHAVSRKTIQGRCAYLLVAVALKVVGPDRVEGDEKNIGKRGCRRVGTRTLRGRARGEAQQQQRESSSSSSHRIRLAYTLAAPIPGDRLFIIYPAKCGTPLPLPALWAWPCCLHPAAYWRTQPNGRPAPPVRTFC